MRTTALLLLLLAGCASAPDLAPPATAIRVSTPCAALAEVPPYPETVPNETLKALGQTCKAGDDFSCARVVYLMDLDRTKLQEWVRIAALAVDACKK